MQSCPSCDRTFDSPDALAQHAKAVHANAPVAKKKIPIPLLVIGAGLVFILVFIGYYASATPGQYDDFAQCIKDSGATFYGAFWCPHCQAQKLDFGKSADKLPYVECSLPDRTGQYPVCTSAGVESYPTWVFKDGSKVTGEMSLKDLAARTGCSLTAN